MVRVSIGVYIYDFILQKDCTVLGILRIPHLYSALHTYHTVMHV